MTREMQSVGRSVEGFHAIDLKQIHVELLEGANTMASALECV